MRFLILILVALPFCVVSQNQEIDSLTNKLNSLEITYKENLSILNRLARIYIDSNQEKSLEYADRLLKLAKKSNNSESEVEALHLKGEVSENKGDYNDAKVCYQEALELSNTDDKIKRAPLLLSLGVVHNKSGAYDLALEFYDKCLKVYKEQNDSLGIMRCRDNIGIVYQNTGKLKEAIEIYQNSLKYYTAINSTENMARTFISIGAIYMRWEENEKALQYYHKAFSIYEEMGNIRAMSKVYNNIGNVFIRQNKLDTAIMYLEKSIKISEEINDNHGIALSLLNIAVLHYFRQEFSESEENLMKSLAMSKQEGYKPLVQKAYYNLHILLKETGKAEKALDYHILYAELKDSLQNNEYSEKIARFVAEMEAEKNEKEVIITAHESKYQTLQFYSAIIFSIITVLVIILLIRAQRLKKRLFRDEKQQLKSENEQLGEQVLNKEKELSSITNVISKKNEIIYEVNNKIDEILPALKDQEAADAIREIHRYLKDNISRFEDWQNFVLHFEKLYPDFTKRIVKDFPELSQNDVKLCAYIKMRLTTKEIAGMQNISMNGLKSAHKRLKKKIGLEPDDSLSEYLQVY